VLLLCSTSEASSLSYSAKITELVKFHELALFMVNPSEHLMIEKCIIAMKAVRGEPLSFCSEYRYSFTAGKKVVRYPQ
jgi:hypothetical protein